MESDNPEITKPSSVIASPLLEAEPLKRRTHSTSSLTDPDNRMSFASSSFFSAGGGSNDGEDDFDNDRDEESPASEDVHDIMEKEEEEGEGGAGEGNETSIIRDTDSKTEFEDVIVTPISTGQPILSSPKLSTRPSPITIPVGLEPSSTNPEREREEEERTPIASTSTSTSQPILPPESTTTSTSIYGICLISFDHSLGPIIEWNYPESLNEDKELVSRLPFLALPDGAHTVSLLFSSTIIQIHHHSE